MALTIALGWAHAIAALKLPSTAFTAEEVKSANDVQSRISGYYNWHWLLTAGTNHTVVAGTQDYTMAAADQNKVQAIATANLLSGTVNLAALNVNSHPLLPKADTTSAARERPYAMGLLSVTQVRYYPVSDAAYTGQWTYYARPIVFAANTESYQCPDSFENVILAGNLWKLFQLLDDDRAGIAQANPRTGEMQYTGQLGDFMSQLEAQEEQERRTMGRNR